MYKLHIIGKIFFCYILQEIFQEIGWWLLVSDNNDWQKMTDKKWCTNNDAQTMMHKQWCTNNDAQTMMHTFNNSQINIKVQICSVLDIIELQNI